MHVKIQQSHPHLNQLFKEEKFHLDYHHLPCSFTPDLQGTAASNRNRYHNVNTLFCMLTLRTEQYFKKPG